MAQQLFVFGIVFFFLFRLVLCWVTARQLVVCKLTRSQYFLFLFFKIKKKDLLPFILHVPVSECTY